MKKIVVFGPGPLFKGGIANYNTSLAKALAGNKDVNVDIVSWTQQYPAIIPRDFIDRKSRQDQLENTGIQVHYITNYNNPFSWHKTYRLIRSLNPDIVVFQWSISIQGIPLGYITKKLRQHTDIEIILDMHFVKQKENSSIDRILTRTGVRHAHTYIVHSNNTAQELTELFTKQEFEIIKQGRTQKKNKKSILKLYHPVYNMFQHDPAFDVIRQKKDLGLRSHVFLFFGFIRKYKGLHFCLEAFSKVLQERDDVSLLIVGESFWNTLNNKKISTRLKKSLFSIAKKIFLQKKDNEDNYRPLDRIKELGIEEHTKIINDFVPNEEVHRYFQVSDSILLFYETATPSGVESISYNFQLPILATAVGHFPETVKDGYNGYLAKPGDTDSMASAMLRSIEKPIERKNIQETSKNMSWENYASVILSDI